MQDYLEVCRIVATHGVRGEMKAELYCDSAAFLAKAKTLYWDDQGQRPVKIRGVRAQGNLALIALEGVEDMDTARAARGKILYMAHDAVKLPKGRYFIKDIIGCTVLDAETGREYGKVKDITHPGAQDIYTVVDETGKEYMFPAVPEFLKEIDVANGVVRICPIPGMFEEAVNGDKE